VINEGEYVYRLGGPHRAGSICGVPCEQCGDVSSPMMMSAPGPKQIVTPIPFYVVREATREEWEADVRKYGGTPTPNSKGHFYVVRPD
jgi:hypothetical protein